MREVIRFNWPYYALSFIFIILSTFLLSLTQHFLLRAAILIAATVSAYFFLSSLIASFLVYDASDLYSGAWLAGLNLPGPIINLHSGYDATSKFLLELYPGSSSYDILPEKGNQEASILRARKFSERKGSVISEKLASRALAANGKNAAVCILSAHEIRDPRERREFFRKLGDSLKPESPIVVVEHLRDIWNFLAYGPGFLHFFSRKDWVSVFSDAGLSVEREFSITPFVRGFLLKRAI